MNPVIGKDAKALPVTLYRVEYCLFVFLFICLLILVQNEQTHTQTLSKKMRKFAMI